MAILRSWRATKLFTSSRVESTASRSTGLEVKPKAPIERPRPRWSSAEMTCTGMCRVSGVRLSRSSRARPSMSGRPMSSMMASGPNRRARPGAATPSPVTTPLKPESRTSCSRIAEKRGSSSTISTTASSGLTSSRSSMTTSAVSFWIAPKAKVRTRADAGRDWLCGCACGLKFSGT